MSDLAQLTLELKYWLDRLFNTYHYIFLDLSWPHADMKFEELEQLRKNRLKRKKASSSSEAQKKAKANDDRSAIVTPSLLTQAQVSKARSMGTVVAKLQNGITCS